METSKFKSGCVFGPALLILLISSSWIQPGMAGTLRPCQTITEFEPEVVPYLIVKPPKHGLEVVYENRFKVMMGNGLTPEETQNPPTWVHWKGHPNKTYLLVMVDITARNESDPGSGYLHWLVGNIPGDEEEQGLNIPAGFEYTGPSPNLREDEEPHLYVYLVYEQKVKEENYMDSAKLPHEGFHLQRFLDRHEIEEPAYAGNFFYSPKPPKPLKCDPRCCKGPVVVVEETTTPAPPSPPPPPPTEAPTPPPTTKPTTTTATTTTKEPTPEPPLEPPPPPLTTTTTEEPTPEPALEPPAPPPPKKKKKAPKPKKEKKVKVAQE